MSVSEEGPQQRQSTSLESYGACLLSASQTADAGAELIQIAKAPYKWDGDRQDRIKARSGKTGGPAGAVPRSKDGSVFSW